MILKESTLTQVVYGESQKRLLLIGATDMLGHAEPQCHSAGERDSQVAARATWRNAGSF